MKILLCGNCQVDGLHVFLARALPQFEFRRLPHLATFYGEFTEEKIADDHAWADLVFFHHKHDHPQDHPTKREKIPLSVWFQSAPFIAQVPQQLWNEYKASGGTPEGAVSHDFDYMNRWLNCWDRMKEKEENEQVPSELRMSRYMDLGFESQLQLTCNHPTSKVFLWWSIMIMEYLGVKPCGNAYWMEDCIRDPNLAGLPCEESATSGARKALGIKWGGRPEDEVSGLQIARERMK